MKIKANIEWRRREEPQHSVEEIVRKALWDAGYFVGHIAVQGAWDEDKPKFAGGKWDENRLPHDEVAVGDHERMTK